MSKNSFAVAMTYCGAVIGAGFATGREVVDFFTAYGLGGLIGVVIAAAMFSWIGVVILDVTHSNPVYSYIDLLAVVLPGKMLIRLADLMFMGTLLTGVGVMAAAGGTVLKGWGLPYMVGCAVFLACCLLLLRRGGTGFVRANCWLVPALVIAIVVLCLVQISTPASAGFMDSPLSSALLYVSFNIAIAGVALSTLKSRLDKPGVIWSGICGGLLIGLLLLVIYGATRGVENYDIPLLRLAEIWLGKWQWIYAFALLAAVFTTALANLHGFASRVAGGKKYWPCLIGTAIGGFILAQRGFASLVAFLYPLLGLCNIVLLAGLCYYSLSKLFMKRR
jgi:uncharacterized membrane protein YkvI